MPNPARVLSQVRRPIPVVRCEQRYALRNVVGPFKVLSVGTHLGDLIHQLLEEAGLTIGQLARASGVDKSIISRLEQQQQASLKAENLARLAQALHTSPDALLVR